MASKKFHSHLIPHGNFSMIITVQQPFCDQTPNSQHHQPLPLKMSKLDDEPALGIPFPAATYNHHHPPPHQYFYVTQNPYQSGSIPPNAILGDPKGVPIQQTIYRDTPAPFSCVNCGDSGLSTVRSKISLAAIVGCMMPMMLGVCCLCPSMNCLWHKYHYCPSCGEKVADFEKTDPCLVMDPPNWEQRSFAVPA